MDDEDWEAWANQMSATAFACPLQLSDACYGAAGKGLSRVFFFLLGRTL